MECLVKHDIKLVISTGQVCVFVSPHSPFIHQYTLLFKCVESLHSFILYCHFLYCRITKKLIKAIMWLWLLFCESRRLKQSQIFLRFQSRYHLPWILEKSFFLGFLQVSHVLLAVFISHYLVKKLNDLKKKGFLMKVVITFSQLYFKDAVLQLFSKLWLYFVII